MANETGHRTIPRVTWKRADRATLLLNGVKVGLPMLHLRQFPPIRALLHPVDNGSAQGIHQPLMTWTVDLSSGFLPVSRTSERLDEVQGLKNRCVASRHSP